MCTVPHFWQAAQWVMACSAGQTAVEARLHEHFVAITGQMLLLAEAGRNAYKPNFNILVVIRALGSFTGQADLASRQSALNQASDAFPSRCASYWCSVVALPSIFTHGSTRSASQGLTILICICMAYSTWPLSLHYPPF